MNERKQRKKGYNRRVQQLYYYLEKNNKGK